MNERSDLVVGVDLGGTKILAVAMRGDEIVATAKRSTPRSGGPSAVLDQVADVVRRLKLDGAPRAIGIGAPGPADRVAGTIGPASNLDGWVDRVDVRAEMQRRIPGVSVQVDNDVNAAAVAEARLGVGRRHRDFFSLFVGTGVGGALVLGGAVRSGAHGQAGEVGHLTVVPGGDPCGCGGFGHVEAYAGRAGIERRARDRHAAGTPTRLVELAGGGRMKSSVIAAALADDDPLVIELIDDAASAIGLAVASIGLVVDVELVAVGGGLAERLGGRLIDGIEQAARAASPWPGSLRVQAAETGDAAGAIGAALFAVDQADD